MTDPVNIRHGQIHLDAAGLFIQWLTEQVNDLVASRAAIHVELRVGYERRAQIRLLVVGSGFRHFNKTWEVKHLNELLRSDNGRGWLLQVEIRDVLRQLRD